MTLATMIRQRKSWRDYRTKFRAYRGNGGTINELRDTYLSIEDQKYRAEKQKPRLREVVEKIEWLNGEKSAKAETITGLREKIRLASSQKARQIIRSIFLSCGQTLPNISNLCRKWIRIIRWLSFFSGD